MADARDLVDEDRRVQSTPCTWSPEPGRAVVGGQPLGQRLEVLAGVSGVGDVLGAADARRPPGTERSLSRPRRRHGLRRARERTGPPRARRLRDPPVGDGERRSWRCRRPSCRRRPPGRGRGGPRSRRRRSRSASSAQSMASAWSSAEVMAAGTTSPSGRRGMAMTTNPRRRPPFEQGRPDAVEAARHPPIGPG